MSDRKKTANKFRSELSICTNAFVSTVMFGHNMREFHLTLVEAKAATVRSASQEVKL